MPITPEKLDLAEEFLGEDVKEPQDSMERRHPKSAEASEALLCKSDQLLPQLKARIDSIKSAIQDVERFIRGCEKNIKAISASRTEIEQAHDCKDLPFEYPLYRDSETTEEEKERNFHYKRGLWLEKLSSPLFISKLVLSQLDISATIKAIRDSHGEIAKLTYQPTILLLLKSLQRLEREQKSNVDEVQRTKRHRKRKHVKDQICVECAYKFRITPKPKGLLASLAVEFLGEFDAARLLGSDVTGMADACRRIDYSLDLNINGFYCEIEKIRCKIMECLAGILEAFNCDINERRRIRTVIETILIEMIGFHTEMINCANQRLPELRNELEKNQEASDAVLKSIVGGNS